MLTNELRGEGKMVTEPDTNIPHPHMGFVFFIFIFFWRNIPNGCCVNNIM